MGISFFFLLFLVGLFRFGSVGHDLQTNRVATKAVFSLFDRGIVAAELIRELERLDDRSCSRYWFLGLLLHSIDRQEERDDSWRKALLCSPRYITVLRVLEPNRGDWAELAFHEYPQNAEAWFWLAKLTSEVEVDRAIELYKHALELNPGYGRGWIEYARLIRDEDPEGAIQAFLHACAAGDPGSNGCYGAGRTAERIGEFERAIRYYRLSRLTLAQDRAEALRRQLDTE